MTKTALRVLIVDDEAPARLRLRDLLGDIAAQQPTQIVGMAGNGCEAMDQLAHCQVDVALVDVRMPVMDGVEFARRAESLSHPPLVIFVTAYDEYAVKAFDLAAADYLMKPVRAMRLAEALGKVRVRLSPVDDGKGGEAPSLRTHLRIAERGRVTLLPLEDVLFFRADSKYTLARTREREFLLDEPLAQIEADFPDRFKRIHRSCLVATAAIVGFEHRRPRADGVADDGGWEVRLSGLDEALPISRRQWPRLKHLAR